MGDKTQSDSAEQRRNALHEKFDQMLRGAGVEESAIERAWEGSFIPYGATGDADTSLSREQNNRMYWADEHDSTRRKIRRLVFGIQDIEVRRSLIKACHDWEEAHVTVLETMERENQRDLLEAQQQSKLSGWSSAAILAVICVAIGYGWFKLPGAIAGAVLGFFWGQRYVALQQTQAEARIREIQGLLQDSKDSLAEERRTPRYFNHPERLTGEPDREFSHQSAVANLYQAIAREKEH